MIKSLVKSVCELAEEIWLNIYEISRELILLFAGFFAFGIYFFAGIIYTAIKHLSSLDYNPRKQLVPIIRSLTLGIDGIANSGGGEMANNEFILEKKKDLKYGELTETISSNTGQNQLKGNLKKNGQIFRKLIDFFLGNRHCINAIKK